VDIKKPVRRNSFSSVKKKVSPDADMAAEEAKKIS
jgi:hypothetical protein